MFPYVSFLVRNLNYRIRDKFYAKAGKNEEV